MTTAIVGDVHGNVVRLRAALSHLVNRVDEIVFVGDYVDRGPASREVLDILVELKASRLSQVTLLRGNHDNALLEFIQSGNRDLFIAHGGLTTVRSYMTDIPANEPLNVFRSTFPPYHAEFLERTSLYLERDDLLVSHCGYNPAFPQSRSLENMVTGRFPDLFQTAAKAPRSLVVFGHYVQDSRAPYVAPGLVCLDTGCGTLPDGPLSVLMLPDHNILQF